MASFLRSAKRNAGSFDELWLWRWASKTLLLLVNDLVVIPVLVLFVLLLWWWEPAELGVWGTWPASTPMLLPLPLPTAKLVDAISSEHPFHHAWGASRGFFRLPSSRRAQLGFGSRQSILGKAVH